MPDSHDVTFLVEPIGMHFSAHIDARAVLSYSILLNTNI